MTGRKCGAYTRREWRSIQWLPGYEISSDGLVRSTIRRSNIPARTVLRGSVNDKNYRVISLRAPTGKKMFYMHRLVCEAFNGPPPTPKHQCAHNDGDETNNHVNNLRWATCKENIADRTLHGTDNRGERNGHAKLAWSDVETIRRRYSGQAGEIASLAREYGLSNSGMRSVCLGRNWRG